MNAVTTPGPPAPAPPALFGACRQGAGLPCSCGVAAVNVQKATTASRKVCAATPLHTTLLLVALEALARPGSTPPARPPPSLSYPLLCAAATGATPPSILKGVQHRPPLAAGRAQRGEGWEGSTGQSTRQGERRAGAGGNERTGLSLQERTGGAGMSGRAAPASAESNKSGRPQVAARDGQQKH